MHQMATQTTMQMQTLRKLLMSTTSTSMTRPHVTTECTTSEVNTYLMEPKVQMSKNNKQQICTIFPKLNCVSMRAHECFEMHCIFPVCQFTN